MYFFLLKTENASEFGWQIRNFFLFDVFLKKLLHFNGEISDLTAKKFAISFKSSTKVLKIICYDCPLCMLALPWIFQCLWSENYEGQILDLKKSHSKFLETNECSIGILWKILHTILYSLINCCNVYAILHYYYSVFIILCLLYIFFSYNLWYWY